jgi:Arc/MetJ family transcription regulator
MPTNLAIDEALLERALIVGGYPSKRQTVNQALREFVQRRQRIELTKLFGKIDYDPRYDYKKERRRR